MHPIRALRERRAMTQQALAIAASVSISTIKRAEAGQSISKESLLSIASVLEAPVDAILNDNEADTRRMAQINRRCAAVCTAAILFVIGSFWYSNWMSGVRLDLLVSAAGAPMRESMMSLPMLERFTLALGQFVLELGPCYAVLALAYLVILKAFPIDPKRAPSLPPAKNPSPSQRFFGGIRRIYPAQD